MSLPISPPFEPMEARTVADLPSGEGWRYEPKWDGFRCLAFRDGERVELQSKATKPLTRYFPEAAAALRALAPDRFVLDGELVAEVDGCVDFDALLQRIHPAASRIERLARESPVRYVVFDLLVDEQGTSLLEEPLESRRRRLEALAAAHFGASGSIRLSPSSDDPRQALRWFEETGGGLDGVVAKRADEPYRTGERAGMVKIKNVRSADCVVGGFRRASGSDEVGSLLLGLYDEEGLLHHVGFTSSLRRADRPRITHELERLAASQRAPKGFTGRAPGGPSRWSTERSQAWTPLPPERVVEVAFDHASGERFRHGTKLLRWRPDKAAERCTMDQLHRTAGSSLVLLRASTSPRRSGRRP